MNQVRIPYLLFTGLDGKALEGGKIYVGEPNQDPVTHPVTVYWDAAGTLPAAQPIRTIAGLPDRSGSPGQLFISGATYSLRITTSTDVLVSAESEVIERVAAANVLYQPLATGADARSIDYRLSERISVMDFGAVGDGVADDSPAVLAAIDWAKTQIKATIYFPTGKYRMASRVNATLTSGRALALIGEGPHSSVLIGDNVDGILALTSAARDAPVYVRGLKFAPGSDNSGTAFSYTVPAGGAQVHRICEIHDCHFTPDTPLVTWSFNNTIVLTGMYRPIINNVVCSPGTGHTTKQGKIVDLSGTYYPVVQLSYFVGKADYGIYHSSNTQEAVAFYGNVINGPDYGVWVTRESNEPGFWFVGNHINARLIGCSLVHMKYGFIAHNLMYGGAVDDGPLYIDFKLGDGCQGIQFSGNIYRGGRVAVDRRHVMIESTDPDSLVRSVYIDDKGFYGQSTGAPIWIGQYSRNVEVRLPQYIQTVGLVNYPEQLYYIQNGAQDVTIHRGNDHRSYADGSADVPVQSLGIDNPSPSDGDIGDVRQHGGRDDSGAWVIYASERVLHADVSAGAHSGVMQQYTRRANVNTLEFEYGGGINVGDASRLGVGTVNLRGNTTTKQFLGCNGIAGIYSGDGSPEGVIAAYPGSLYLNTTGGAGVSLYVKETGIGVNGWVGK